MKKSTKKILVTTSIALTIGGVALYFLKKNPTSDEVHSLGQLHKHLDKMLQGGGGKAEEIAYDCIDEITDSAEEILSNYPSGNKYIIEIKRTLGLL